MTENNFIITILSFSAGFLAGSAVIGIIFLLLHKKISAGFENIAAKILKENSSELTKTNNEEIQNLLLPFRQKLLEFESRVEHSAIEGAKGFSSLEAHIRLLSENSNQICIQANNLAQALKGQAKIQGDWGEIILHRILEVSGMVEGQHYDLQKTFFDKEESGSLSQTKILRPDALIYLPQDRHIIIDAKVSLVAYERYCNSSQEHSQTLLKDFNNSVKEHIKSLQSKYYQEIKELNQPDFVLMFIPIEGAFGLIFRNDNQIIDFGWKNKVILTSPSTLLSALKIIEFFWKQEKQTRNVIEIANESGKLYDKFVGLLQDLENIKSGFNKTFEHFDTAKRKLEGRGNLINQVEKLRELGAKTSKIIETSYFKDLDKENAYNNNELLEMEKQ